MLIVMKPQATEDDVRNVCAKIESMGFRPHAMPGAQRTAIGILTSSTSAARRSLAWKPTTPISTS